MPNELIQNENHPPEKTELDDDLKFVREKQIDIIKTGHDNVDGIVDVASQSQHPRAYEVLSIYLKTLSELNKDLVAIAERKNYRDAPPKDASQVTNQLFVGSTAELANMLKGVKNE